MSMDNGGMILTREHQRILRKTCPSVTLSTKNPSWIDPGVNPGLHSERPVTKYLSHGTAHLNVWSGCITFLPPTINIM
jgi:hypothetical protein